MQEWITTTYLMAMARVSRPERDYPYLGFSRRHLMETLVATLSSAIGRVTSISFFPNSRKFLCWIFRFAFRWLYTLISSRFRRFSTNSMREYDFSSSFTDSFRFETESPLLPIDVELDYSNSRINVCIYHTQEWPTNMRGIVVSTSMSRMTKSMGTKKFHIFTGISSAIPAG